MAIAANPSADVAQAAALWTFVTAKNSRFSSNAALDIVHALGAVQDVDVRMLAKRLRQELLRHGVNLKHSHALQAAARLQGHESWHTLQPTRPATGITVALLYGDTEPEHFADWRQARQRVLEGAKLGLGNASARLLKVLFRHFVGLFVPWKDANSPQVRLTELPAVVVAPAAEGADIWVGAAMTLESVRRSIEEAGLAFVDGVEVARVADSLFEARNTELVLIATDANGNDLFEVSRGSELECFVQLELLHDRDELASCALDGALWRIGDKHLAWQTCTTTVQSGITVRHVEFTQEQTAHLLHRFRLALRLFPEGFKAAGAEGRRTTSQDLPEKWAVDVDLLKREMSSKGLVWADFALPADGPEPSEQMSVGTVVSLAAALELEDPNTVFARPKNEEFSAAGDMHVLRSAILRAHRLRHSFSPTLSEAERAAGRQAVESLLDCMQTNGLQSAGLFADAPIAHMARMSDIDEFKGTLDEAGLTFRVALQPLLQVIAPEHRVEGASPFAVGSSLLVHIQPVTARGGRPV